MSKMENAYIEKIYAGWLAKIIGIRLGAPIEGWTYEKIKNIYGELNHYPVDYREFAADDDSNGPLFFLRAIEDSGKGSDFTAQDVGEALLNYAPFEHGFFWWGGYGISTEHTAYLNLRNGIKAPRSGSIEQNGNAVAEQIGGQIFIDTWGLVTPGNPDLAAQFASKAASVTHGGNGVYGGVFIAVCISYAFVETDIRNIINKGLSYIPEDCEYAEVVRAVMDYYDKHHGSWRDCFKFIFDNYGYDKYPGNCHIIPNSAVMVLALMYGEGDFSDTINICNMCGWDTDCNVGNIATIMGVRGGLKAIDYEKWRKPIGDFLTCSSVIGSLNIMDIPYGASYIAKLAYKIAGEELLEPWREIIDNRIDSCHFEYEGSTHAIRVRTEYEVNENQKVEYELINTSETAHTGERALKAMVRPVYPASKVYMYKKTYYKPADYHDSRYDPSFSPLIYPGQHIHGSAFIPEYGVECSAQLYVRDSRTGEEVLGDSLLLTKGKWQELSFHIPYMEGALLDEMGFIFRVQGENRRKMDFVGLIDDLYADGNPAYKINFEKEQEEIWTPLHREISQFTRLKGLFYLADNTLNLSCSDFAEAYTGRYDWTNYTARFDIIPITGENHYVNVRVQGAIRSYAVGFMPDNKIGILKNENGYRVLAGQDFSWKYDECYSIEVKVDENRICVSANGQNLLEYIDNDQPYLQGAIGVSVKNGSHCRYRSILVK